MQFDVLPDGRILIDDLRTELPFHYLNTHVIRVGENEVQLVSERGFKLICDIVHDQCSLTVAGWYHGKLAGLFGTKNFEKADDFLNSEGVQVLYFYLVDVITLKSLFQITYIVQ